MQTHTKSVQKLITFSPQLYQLVLNKAKRLGLSFAEFLRLVAVNEIKKEVEEIPMVDKETEKRIGESIAAYKRGQYTVLETDEDIRKHFKNLQKHV